jgi:hypothetical protein
MGYLHGLIPTTTAHPDLSTIRPVNLAFHSETSLLPNDVPHKNSYILPTEEVEPLIANGFI